MSASLIIYELYYPLYVFQICSTTVQDFWVVMAMLLWEATPLIFFISSHWLVHSQNRRTTKHMLSLSAHIAVQSICSQYTSFWLMSQYIYSVHQKINDASYAQRQNFGVTHRTIYSAEHSRLTGEVHDQLKPSFISQFSNNGQTTKRTLEQLLAGKTGLLDLFLAHCLLNDINKYAYEHAPNIQGTCRSGCSLRRRIKTRITYALGTTKSHDKHQICSRCGYRMCIW